MSVEVTRGSLPARSCSASNAALERHVVRGLDGAERQQRRAWHGADQLHVVVALFGPIFLDVARRGDGERQGQLDFEEGGRLPLLYEALGAAVSARNSAACGLSQNQEYDNRGGERAISAATAGAGGAASA